MSADVPHRKIIFLDTNIYRQDFTQSGQKFEALYHYLNASNSILVIPDVISDEVKKLYREKADEDFRKVGRIAQGYSGDLRILGDSAKAIKSFEAAWDERLMAHNSIEVALTPGDLTVDMLLKRSIKEHPPFGHHSKGFRDAVIWETILADMRNRYERVTRCFITQNSEDFGKDSLRDELKAEIGANELSYYNTLEGFLADNQLNLPFLNIANAERWIAKSEAGLRSLVQVDLSELDCEDFVDLESLPHATSLVEVWASGVKYHGYKVHHPFIFREDQFNYYVRVEVDVFAKVRVSFRYEQDDGKSSKIDIREGTTSRIVLFDYASHEYKINKKTNRRTNWYEDL